METTQRNKMIGLGMMVVAAAVVGGLLVLTKFGLWLIVGLVCGVAFYAGLKLFKGATPKEIIEDAKEDISKVT